MAIHFETSQATVYFNIVTGTHSSGKTTLLNDLGESLPRLEIEPPFRAVSEEIGGKTIPIVLVPEAATYYARSVGRPDILTNNYSFEQQVQIEFVSAGMVASAVLLAEELAVKLQTSGSRHGFIISDRSMLDGHVYSRLRTPDHPDDPVNLRQVAAATGMLLLSPTQPDVDIRHIAREQVAAACDTAYISDHHDIPFEDNGLRQADLEFRDLIAGSMAEYYEDVVGTKKVHYLRGDRAQRLAALRANIVRNIL